MPNACKAEGGITIENYQENKQLLVFAVCKEEEQALKMAARRLHVNGGQSEMLPSGMWDEFKH